MAFTVRSSAFAEGATIPRQFTCDGTDSPPPLTIADPPAGTKSFAIIMDDPDAPRGLFTHWLAYDIQARGDQLNVDAARTLGNDFGRQGYGGPCPPRGHGPHRYYFKVYALGEASLRLSGRTRKDLEKAVEAHTLARTQLMGRYERP
jgi:Raf kinase inhibitor-like YbhB/YbcL family protein